MNPEDKEILKKFSKNIASKASREYIDSVVRGDNIIDVGDLVKIDYITHYEGFYIYE